jgi:hypothetical protein
MSPWHMTNHHSKEWKPLYLTAGRALCLLHLQNGRKEDLTASGVGKLGSGVNRYNSEPLLLSLGLHSTENEQSVKEIKYWTIAHGGGMSVV